MDAGRMVDMATKWKRLPNQHICQVWSLTQFNSVGFLKIKDQCKKWVSDKAFVSCFWQRPGTFVPSTTQLTVSVLVLCSSRSNAQGKIEGPWWASWQLKKLQGSEMRELLRETNEDDMYIFSLVRGHALQASQWCFTESKLQKWVSDQIRHLPEYHHGPQHGHTR